MAALCDSRNKLAMDKNIQWIKAELERTGQSQAGLARAIGIDPSGVTRMMAGNRRVTKEEWDRILAWFAGFEAPAPLAEPERVNDNELNLPVYGSARGGLEGDFIDIANPIAWRRIPEWLRGSKGAMALRISGDSMEPRYYHGDLLWISPERPIRRNDFVLLEYVDGRGVIKRFLGSKGEAVEVEQLNPRRKLSIRRTDLRRILRVIGMLEE